ncbi:MAG TPA: beta-propeller fold lactonase family protein [Candidatus Acidoferrum sp.]|nr:beta-propeller fold lactonase family protein [Candidatus Acidoferrum sp.]
MNVLFKFKQLVQVLPLLSLLGLAGCISSDVSNLFITGVKLTPANPTIAVAATQQFALTATYVDGQTSNVTTSDSTYSSDNKAVATVNASGLATAVAVGTANILASYHGNNTKTLLTVTAAANVVSAVQGDSRLLHVTNMLTGQRMTFAANGLEDSLMISRDGEGGAATEVSVLPEHGPAWLAIDPSAHYLYVVNHTSQSISAFSINWKTGELNAVVASPFPAASKPSSVEVNADGTGLSVAHFEDSSVSHFRIDPATGALTPEP